MHGFIRRICSLGTVFAKRLYGRQKGAWMFGLSCRESLIKSLFTGCLEAIMRCNALFYKASLLSDLKKDFTESMHVSRERTLADENNGLIHGIIDGVMRIFAPLV